MESPGHRANIMNPNFGYMGVGYNSKTKSWVQIFATSASIKNVTTTTVDTTITQSELSKHYLKLEASNGYISFMPADFTSMKQTEDRYTPGIACSSMPTFYNAEEKVSNGETQPTEIKREEIPASLATPTTPVTPTTPTTPTNVVTQFTDVAPDAWYAAPVSWAVEKNITTGTSATTFSPDNTCTRAQILTFMWRAVGSPKMTISNPFLDVKPTDYFYDAALWAYSKSMVCGNKFEGDTPCTRGATVIYLWQNANSPNVGYSGNFTDVSIATDYAVAVAWAVANGVTSGTSDTTFSPDNTCTRGQIVTFLMRALK